MTVLPLSIIMPVYNAEAYLREAVGSILAQTYTDFELIIVEDGSTDNSREIINSFIDSRIRLLINDGNRGIVFSRNRGNAAARGRYIAPFDADDIARVDKFEKQLSFLEANPEYGMIGAWAKLIDKNGKPLREKWKVNAPPERIPSILLFRNYFVQSSVVLRREAIPPGGYEEGLDAVEDYMMWTQISSSWKVWNYPEYLVNYRIHDQGISMREANTITGKDDDIYRDVFKTLEINLDGRQCQLIHLIRKCNGIIDIKTFKEVEGFLIHVLNQNKKHKALDHRELKKAIINRWIKVCYHTSIPLHKRLWAFLNSPILHFSQSNNH
jgi:glycosyltransferase involved in cell wall biosynthesis